MIAYVDASMLAKLFLDEDGAAVARRLWQSDLHLATTRIAHAELVCALTAAARAARLPEKAMPRGLVDGTLLWDRVDAVEATAEITGLAARLGAEHRLRALDAVHVASALSLRALDPVLVTWDDAQRRAATAERVPVYP